MMGYPALHHHNVIRSKRKDYVYVQHSGHGGHSGQWLGQWKAAFNSILAGNYIPTRVWTWENNIFYLFLMKDDVFIHDFLIFFLTKVCAVLLQGAKPAVCVRGLCAVFCVCM